jgi:hypothetical protein
MAIKNREISNREKANSRVPPQSSNARLGALIGGNPKLGSYLGRFRWRLEMFSNKWRGFTSGVWASLMDRAFFPLGTQTIVARLRWHPAATSKAAVRLS